MGQGELNDSDKVISDLEKGPDILEEQIQKILDEAERGFNRSVEAYVVLLSIIAQYFDRIRKQTLLDKLSEDTSLKLILFKIIL